ALDDTADGEHFATARTAAGNDHAVEDLNSLFLTFENSSVNVDGVADLELRHFGLQRAFFDKLKGLLTHGTSFFRVSVAIGFQNIGRQVSSEPALVTCTFSD